MSTQSLPIQIKYILDRIAAILLLVLLWPLLVVIAAAIKLSDGGPVFFKHRRPGWNGRLFTIWKFRTMVVDADRFLDEKGRVTVADRVTPVGRVLRKLSLDELPQLFCILVGDMSFVGPRPAVPEHVARYTNQQKRRFCMKPGITGLAQINGRNTLKWSKRIEYDLQYIEHYHLWLDVKILLKTVKVVLFQEGIVLDRNPGDVDDLKQFEGTR